MPEHLSRASRCWPARWVIAVLIGLSCLVPSCAQAQGAREPPGAGQWRSVIKDVMAHNEKLLLVGDVDGFVAAIQAAARPDDWVSLLVAGDGVYSVAPAAAIPLHEAAARMAPDQALPQLELAFDYQRAGQCERAVPAWQAADKLGAVVSPITGIAAYCFFRLGRIDEALDLWSRFQWPSHRLALDRLVAERAMGTKALDIHTRAYAQARAGDEKALGTLIANSLKWRRDFWNESINRGAFQAARELARVVRPADDRLHRELDCADEAISALDAQSLRGVLRRCGFLIDGGGLPTSPDVLKFLFARVDWHKVEAPAEMLRRHGTALDARARSEAGDLPALEVLAFLQASAREPDALKATDELGWRRYRVANFAVSRIAGLARDRAEWVARGEKLLAEALNDFPDVGYLHELRYTQFHPAPAERVRYLTEWALAEYAGLSSSLGLPSTRTLASVVYTLRRNRDASGTLAPRAQN